MVRTKSSIWSSASAGGFTIRSMPSPITFSSKSVTRAATSMRRRRPQVEPGHLAVDPDESVVHEGQPYAPSALPRRCSQPGHNRRVRRPADLSSSSPPSPRPSCTCTTSGPRRHGSSASWPRGIRGACRVTSTSCAGFYAFRDFAHFIEVYLAVVDLIRTAEDVRYLTYEVAREMAGQQIRYAELTCTPYTSVQAGVPIEAYVEAIEDARVAAERDFGLVLRWVFDIPGESGLPAADATLDLRTRPRTRGARRLRSRRTRGRRAARAVPSPLRRRASGGTALVAARG